MSTSADTAATSIKQKDIKMKFLEVQGTDSSSAVSLDKLNLTVSPAFSKMLKQNVIVNTEEDSYYFDTEKYNELMEKKVNYLKMPIGIILIIAIALIIKFAI